MTQFKDTYHTGCIFKITLHSKETALLEGLYDYFSNYFMAPPLLSFLPVVAKLGRGSTPTIEYEGHISFNKYNSRTNKGISFSKETVSLTISNIKDIGNIVIPFFDLYPVLGIKKMDYNDFKKIYNIILSKDHLSPEGLARIQQIRNNMNNKRLL
uniref:LAGLIDADG homing endonuclease n=1 Tax=Elmerina hispida TaxID=1245649 RepID=UPI0030032E33|nr:LAGLIDADG homing endonuclease [Elmerina hispida]